MLIRFTSKAGPDILMFESHAQRLLRMMQHSGTVPSALSAQDIGVALDRLEHALREAAEQAEQAHAPNTQGDVGATDADGDKEKDIGIQTRAYPLLQLLKAAKARQAAVMWDYDDRSIVA